MNKAPVYRLRNEARLPQNTRRSTMCLHGLVKERNALPWKRHFREAVYFRTGAKDSQLSLIFSENSQFSLREDIDDGISFSNLFFICAQFGNIFGSYLKQENVKTKKKTFQWLKIILNPSSLQVTAKGENFKKFLPPNYSLCLEWERKMVNTFVDIVKWKLDGGLTMLNFIFSWRKAISLLTRCARSYHFVCTTRLLLKKKAWSQVS